MAEIPNYHQPIMVRCEVYIISQAMGDSTATLDTKVVNVGEEILCTVHISP